MKITCTKNALVTGISIVSRAIPVRSTMPMMECILIDASTDKILLLANDMEIGIQTTVEGEILDRGIIAVEASVFSSIVRKLPDEEVRIETNGEELLIRCGKARFNIMGHNGSDFTYLPEIEKNDGINVSQFTLKEMIIRTIFSTSDNDSNRLMTGELVEIKNGTLTMVTLDGHRISLRRTELNGSYNNRRVTIPGKAMSEISKILSGNTDKNVSLFFTDKHVLFEFDETLVVVRLLDGDYFHIETMLNGDYETRMTINRRELLDCIDRATLLVKEGDKKPIILTIGDTSLALQIRTTLGSMDESIDVTKTGSDLMIAFNPRFFIDALRAIDDEEIDIYFVNPKAPCFIRNADESYNYVILPVNFNTAG